jgi:hypothetical protein
MNFAVAVTLLLLSRPSWAWTVVGAGLQGWTDKPLVVQYNFTDCPFPEATMLDYLNQTLQTINASRDAGLKLTVAGSAVSSTVSDVLNQTASVTPIIICDTSFSSNQGLDGDVIPASTRLGTLSGHVAYAGLVLNAEAGKASRISNLSTSQLLTTLAHEMGHVLGLGHSSNTSALMYYSISNKSGPVLTQDDMDGIAFLYPRNEFTGGVFGCASSAFPPSRKNGLWAFALLLAIPWGAGHWFRRRLDSKPFSG